MADDQHTDRNHPPARTDEMKVRGQHWVWLWDKPLTEFMAKPDPDESGRWEVRGTGLRLPVTEGWYSPESPDV